MKRFTVAAIGALVIASAGQAAVVDIDLSGASEGTLVSGTGASFAQTFVGQSVVGNVGISGTPSGPLALQPAGTILVAFFDPGVSPAASSLFSQPDNQGPLAVLLGSDAAAFSFTMGSAFSGSTIDYSFFGLNGSLLGSGQIVMGSGYQLYTISNASAFRGISFFDNNDSFGVRFMNMSYRDVPGVIPEPAT